ncbi:unnamed protein product [Pocillopora meandrina]|uniref:CHAT domain-containing protein n=1 Tax=Pocillopora meandrina TaxID=46732 RepID=A0AAU9X1P5_9CNID|nr:unnamed protein product [Pocillopora meandrina]
MAVREGIGDRRREAADYRHLGKISCQRGEYDKVQEYYEKALTIHMEIGEREGVVVIYVDLGLCFTSLGKNDIAEEYFKQALLLSRDIGQHLHEFYSFLSIGFDTLRGFPKENDQFQISLLEEHSTFPYMFFSWLLSSTGKPQDALYVEELKRARGPGRPDGSLVLLLRDYDAEDFKTSLHLCYKIIIAPVASLLKQPEIIIVPDSCVYQVPFAALADEGGKYLSETCRIRLVPSLTTLKLVQDSPPDYHSQTGALIVGDPVVGKVIYKGRCRDMTPLPCARKEAEMIGTLLGVTPLIRDSATKHSVLQAINSVSLIHIAAHDDAERGEITLSPRHPTLLPPFPREEEYLLTMADISKTRLRAKLVVLSCCHSARGQIRTEGVIGIARAFLGSGARSVLAARWALDDTATEQFMTCFYKHLFRGESASESLHKARKWMRNNGFDKVSQWAPFMIMGDNVTFDFGNWPVPSAP